MDEQDEVMYLISLIPVNTDEWGMPPFVPDKPGYKVIECEGCHQWAWIGPDQMQRKQEVKLTALCMVCILHIAQEQGVDPATIDIKSLNHDGRSRIL